MNKLCVSCVYIIINKINNKVYIGSTNNFSKRKSGHFIDLENNQHGNSHLQKSYNKYGKDKFEMKILEKCKTKDLFIKEKEYSDKYNSFKRDIGYNICPIPKTQIDYPKETRLKMSESGKKKWNNGYSKEHIKQLTAKKVYMYDVNGILIKEYKSGAELAKEYNTTSGIVSQCIKRNKLIKNKKSVFNGKYLKHSK